MRRQSGGPRAVNATKGGRKSVKERRKEMAKKREYKFDKGDKVVIKVSRTATVGALQHNGETVTIKARCPFTWAYELEELDGLWTQGCFRAAEKGAEK